MSDDKIALAKAIGWSVSPSYKGGYYLYTPDELNIYEPDDNEEIWEPVNSEVEAWALLPDDPLKWWLDWIEVDRDWQLTADKNDLDDAIKEAEAEYKAQVKKHKAIYRERLKEALAAAKEFKEAAQ